MSLWDRLPPEIQEYILRFATYIGAAQCPLKPCHKDILCFCFHDDDNLVLTVSNTWPMPHRKPFMYTNMCQTHFNRTYECQTTVKVKKDKFGCLRYYRRVYYRVYDDDVIDSSKTYCLDVTQATPTTLYTPINGKN